MTPRKKYLGDGVYAEWDAAERLVIYTSNGLEERNRIVLEEDVWFALFDFVEKGPE